MKRRIVPPEIAITAAAFYFLGFGIGRVTDQHQHDDPPACAVTIDTSGSVLDIAGACRTDLVSVDKATCEHAGGSFQPETGTCRDIDG